MTQRRADHQHWPVVPDAEPGDIYRAEKYELERKTTEFLTLLWRQRMIAEDEAKQHAGSDATT